MPSDPLSRPLIEIARELRERRPTARELVEAAIARHERFGERLHAYSFWAPEQARAVADAADAAFAAGVSAGPLQGLPVSIKDLFAAAGYPCFAGSSRRLPADPWERDGPLVATLRRQLGVIMGKTHMVEFAFGGTGQNSHHGAPYNPWDAAAHRSVGGSSSGAGVSLLEGSALLAFGSDTAGSVRIPACMTGNAGLKVTTRALVHRRCRAAVLHVRHAGAAGAQRLRSRLRLCRARSRRHRSGHALSRKRVRAI